jgi:hypothetical protein
MKVGASCRKQEKEEKPIKILVRKLEEEEFLKTRADWKIILKEILHSRMGEYQADIDSVYG